MINKNNNLYTIYKDYDCIRLVKKLFNHFRRSPLKKYINEVSLRLLSEPQGIFVFRFYMIKFLNLSSIKVQNILNL